MCDSTPDVVRQPIFNGMQGYPGPLSDPNAELFPEITALEQYFQNPYLSSNCIGGTYYPPFPGSSDTRTSIWAIPGNSGIQNITTRWPASATGQISFRETPTPNEPTVSHWSGMYKDGLGMEHYPALIAPTMPRIGPPGNEVSRNNTHPGVHLRYQPKVSLHYSEILPARPHTSLESISESPSQAVGQSPSQECYNLWKKIPVDAVVIAGSNKFVPQTLYKPLTEADKERYLERVSLSPPIIFMTKKPLEWGIPLEDVRNGKTQRLVDKDVLVLQDCGPSVSIRINWPGYSSFKRQISSRNWRKMKGPITKERLARSLAKTTDQFVEKMSHKPLGVDAEKIWRVGTQHIKVEDLILVSLHHVSKGSWQPQFRLRRDLT